MPVHSFAALVIFCLPLVAGWTDGYQDLRASIPGDITAKTPNPTNWGKPVAFRSSSTCDIASHFQDQVITVGGLILPIESAFDYVGLTQRFAVTVSNSSCISRIKENFKDGKRGRKCFSWRNVYVEAVANPVNLVFAKWKLNYVSVYES
ncbi:hypothetical protein B0H13DRAFT_1910526 [Mycena leptocephala]|nr:hypothetical protein B0H13DRAFT_1910526 [Mycena leptocephala]